MADFAVSDAENRPLPLMKLNPKNALFYVSLAAAVHTASPLTALARLGCIVPSISEAIGRFLVLFGTSMICAYLV
ncbi:MAG: hypothetical protein R2722_05375 [Tessaracoccus sp.]